MLGIFIPFMWYIVSAQDRSLVVQYRDRLMGVAKSVDEIPEVQGYEERHPDIGAKTRFDVPSVGITNRLVSLR